MRLSSDSNQPEQDCEQLQHMNGSEKGAHGSAACQSTAGPSDAAAVVLGPRPQPPATGDASASDNPYGGGLQLGGSTRHTSTLDATACSVILRKISFPIDQLTVLNILLPLLVVTLSWEEIEQIVRSVSTDWCRVAALRTLISQCTSVPDETDKARIVQGFTSSYYRNKVSTILDEYVGSS